MNEFITKIGKFVSIEALIERGWLEVVQILMPIFILVLVFLGLSFFIQNKRWKTAASVVCAVLALVYLPYELYRQSIVSARADANVREIHSNLQDILNSANLSHLKDVADKEVATNMLDQLILGLDQEKKKDLLLIAWLVAENEKDALNQVDGKQKVLADDIKSSLSAAKTEIIDSRPPIEKISDTIVKKLDDDVKQLVEKKMRAFKQEIDSSLDGFKEGINTFVQGELNNYQEKLAGITQQNVDELKNYSGKANQAFAEQAKKINQESMKKLDETKQSIDGIGVTISDINLKNIAQQVKQLSASLEIAQKKNDVLFEYNECMRTAGLLDLGGKVEHCKSKLNQDMSNLK
ncbi:hypothetical protein [Nitrosomonas sp.]|uniref:hypothetical protein n=1 Tax=Nitrosomonas sp. TaxID=42353 RepID=UPI0025DAA0B1|nr:hypothetical protein [Nitrosomonas sp.]